MNALLSITQAQARMQMRGENFALGTETRAVAQACGATLATDIHAPIDLPPFAVSAMDGIALQAADKKAVMPISAIVYAGMDKQILKPHTAARIFTGAVVPQGADTVVTQEQCIIEDKQVTLPEQFAQGAHIRHIGSDITQGTLVLHKNTTLTPLHLAVCTALGIDNLSVYRPLKVCVLTTGDELIMPPTARSGGQIYNSNATLLTQLLTGWHCAVTHQHIKDDRSVTENACRSALAEHDLVITTGGVSVGDADYIKDIQCATIDFWGVSVRPGKPFLFAHTNKAFLCGVPGNPVSVLVAACLFLRPFVRLLQTQRYTTPQYSSAVAQFTSTKINHRDELRRVHLHHKNNTPVVTDINKHESHMLASCLSSDALAHIPAGTFIKQGDQVNYISLADALA